MTRASIEERILALFASGNEYEAFNISDVAKRIDAAYPHTHATIKQLQKDGLLSLHTLGRAHFCRANLANPLTRNLVCREMLAKNNRLFKNQNVHNLLVELQKQFSNEPNLVAALLHNEKIILIVTDLSVRNRILRKTSMLHLKFHTLDSFKESLETDPTLLRSNVLLGYERLLLSLATIQNDLFFNHASIFKEVRK